MRFDSSAGHGQLDFASNTALQILGSMRLPGSSEMITDAAGELNAGSKKELARKVFEVANTLHSEAYRNELSSVERERVAKRNDSFKEAASDLSGVGMKELGATFSAEILRNMERGGFFRRLLQRAEFSSNGTIRIRMREPQVNAIIATGPAQCSIQLIRQKYFQPTEFTMQANPRVMDLDLLQGTDDILGELRDDALESFMVGEDRLLLKQLYTAADMINDTVSFVGQLTPTVIALLQERVGGWRLPIGNLILSWDLVKDLTTGDAFSEWFDPVSKLEIVMTGMIGTLLGLSVSTDGYRDPRLRVLGDGEALVTATPQYLGAFTDRGPVQAEPRVNDKDMPARGWYMYEHISSLVANPKAVARAKRV